MSWSVFGRLQVPEKCGCKIQNYVAEIAGALSLMQVIPSEWLVKLA